MSEKKRVLLTGASAGFGFEVAKALAERGHTVYATMRGVAGKNKHKAQELESFAKDNGLALRAVELDVVDDNSVNSALKSILERGGIDTVLNNAGVGNFGIDEGFTVEQAQQLFNINLFGAMRVNRAVLPHLRSAKKGLIVYTSSGLGRIVLPFFAIYNASKFALEAYVETTNIELSPLGIQSVIIEPGAYGTTFLNNSMHPDNDMAGVYGPTAQIYQAFGNSFEQRVKAGQLGDPSEVIAAMVEEVERPVGPRPLRRTVGRDVMEPVSAINKTCEQVQGQLLKAFGIG